jgi:DNA-binding CsgD family transcriptional regulator
LNFFRVAPIVPAGQAGAFSAIAGITDGLKAGMKKAVTADSPSAAGAVFILGAANFQNEALAYALSSALGLECICVSDACAATEAIARTTAKTKILMIEHPVPDIDAVIGKSREAGRASWDGVVPSLYNLEPGLGMEKKQFTLGVRGFFYRTDSLELIVRGLRALMGGELWMSRSLLVQFALMGGDGPGATDKTAGLLTHRETQILALVSTGASNEEIAEKLTLSPHTVKTHLYNVFKKINVPNRFQAALWAAKNL